MNVRDPYIFNKKEEKNILKLETKIDGVIEI